MVERDAAGNYVRILCDKCRRETPPIPEIMRNHGLIGLGWHCAGGKHVCATCKEPTGE